MLTFFVTYLSFRFSVYMFPVTSCFSVKNFAASDFKEDYLFYFSGERVS